MSQTEVLYFCVEEEKRESTTGAERENKSKEREVFGSPISRCGTEGVAAVSLFGVFFVPFFIAIFRRKMICFARHLSLAHQLVFLFLHHDVV